MKAIVYRDNGGPDVLELVDREPAAPGPGQVRVRVAVSGVNPTDWKTRSGATNPKLYAEVTPGLDGAGVIDAVGPGEDESRIGRRVWLFLAGAALQVGTVAESIVVPSDRAVPLSVNRGRAVVSDDPRSRAARSLMSVSRSLVAVVGR